jgi:hypothetical protein
MPPAVSTSRACSVSSSVRMVIEVERPTMVTPAARRGRRTQKCIASIDFPVFLLTSIFCRTYIRQ